MELCSFMDADWGSDPTDRRSYARYVFFAGGCSNNVEQPQTGCVSKSTVEAEFLAMSQVAEEAIWLCQFFEEIGAGEFINNSVEMYADNQGAISLVRNQITSDRSKCISLKYFFIHDLVDRVDVNIQYVASVDNTADILTKVGIKNMTECHVKGLGLRLWI